MKTAKQPRAIKTRDRILRDLNGKDDLVFAVIDHAMDARTRPAFGIPLGEFFDEIARYILSVIEAAIMLSRTHRDVQVIEGQVHHQKEDVKRSSQKTDQRKDATKW